MKTSSNPRTSLASRSLVVVVLGLLSMAPTAGDVGGCGTEVTDLDPAAFILARKDMDCSRCQECSIGTQRCLRACNPNQPPDTNLPSTCRPIQHDGEVCLRKLEAASCDTYGTYVDDFAPATPSECEFCQFIPEDGIPVFVIEAGASDSSVEASAP